MNILIISIMRKFGETGVQVHINTLIDQLKRIDSNETDFLSPFNYFKILYIPFFAFRKLLDLFKLRSYSIAWYRLGHYIILKKVLMRKMKSNTVSYKIVNAQCPLSALAAIKVRKKLKLSYKVILTVHFNKSQADEFIVAGSIKENSRIEEQIRNLESLIFKKVDGVVFVSKEMEREIKERYNISSWAETSVIYNGVDDLNSSSKDNLNSGKDEIKNIVNIGTMETRKNQLFLIDVMKEIVINQKRKDIILNLVGQGPDMFKIENKIKKNRLEDHVLMLGYRTDIKDILNNSKLYVHSAQYESFGIVLIEALSASIPIIAPPVGGIPEIFGEEEDIGLLVKTESPKMYADSIIKLIDSSNYHDYKYRARKRYMENFSSQIMGQKYIELYNLVLNAGD